MTKKGYLLVFSLVFVLSACAYFTFFFDGFTQPVVPNNSPDPTNQQQPSDPEPGGKDVQDPGKTDRPAVIHVDVDAEKEPYCYIREFNGRVAIYSSETAPVPDIITDIDLSYLPATDQHTIREGFPLYSDKDLTALLEDLGG